MGIERLQVLGLAEAANLYQRLPLPLRPATLHPAYVAADAIRNPLLQPVYLHYQSQSEHWLHSLHLTAIPGTRYLDASSPYGYGGPLCTCDDPAFVAQAWAACTAWMQARGGVVEYIRFHPLLANQRHYGGTVVPNREVVWVDLRVPDLLATYAPRLRTTLNKAQRSGLAYTEMPLTERSSQAFGVYYRAAMQAMGADLFYAFDDAYFAQIAASGLARLGMCHEAGAPQGPWMAAALLLDGGDVTEYHLAATCEAGRQVGASSYVLHQAALSARQRGIGCLYLGGGSTTQPDNPLLFFKASFSAQRLMYHTGFHVFDRGAYDTLCGLFPDAWAAHPERPIFYRKV